MSHTWNFELKIYVKWLIKFRRWIVQKMKVSTIVDFRGFKIRDRHNSSTWVIVKFLFSIFKNSIRVMIKYNFRPFETLQRPENPVDFVQFIVEVSVKLVWKWAKIMKIIKNGKNGHFGPLHTVPRNWNLTGLTPLMMKMIENLFSELGQSSWFSFSVIQCLKRKSWIFSVYP